MEVKPGYKQTEVGVIPKDWYTKALGEVGEALIGLTYKPEDVRGYGTLVLRSSNIQEGSLRFDDNVFVEKNIAERIMVRPGDILICVRNGSRNLIGKTALLEDRTVGMTFGAFMAVFRSPAGKFINYLFQSEILKRQINEHLGATINQITNKSINSFQIPLPSTEVEQRAIATALSDVDGLLGGLNRLIAKKRDLKQAAMQQLLTGQTRLPGFHGEWEVRRLDELGSCFAGGTPSTTRSDYWGGDVLWLPSGRVQNNILAVPIDSEIRITRKGLTESAAKSIKPHSVLVAITGATCANVALLQFEAAANQSVVAIEPFDDANANFLFYSLLMERGQILSRQSGSAQGGVNLKTVKGITIRCPSPPEQRAIAEVLTEMDAGLAALGQRREKTRALKQAMMQELLTGRTRLV